MPARVGAIGECRRVWRAAPIGLTRLPGGGEWDDDVLRQRQKTATAAESWRREEAETGWVLPPPVTVILGLGE